MHAESYQVEFYYAEIYKMFRSFKEAMERYNRSKEALVEYKNRKKKERELKGVSAMAQLSTRIYAETKKDNHELICRVKIIECQARLKDYTFWKDLEKVIQELEKETIQYNQIENTKITDTHDKLAENGLSQLHNLLKYCRGLYKHYEIRKQQSTLLSNPEGSSEQPVDPII